MDLVTQGVDAVGQKSGVGVLGPLDLAVDQHCRNEKAPGGEVKDVLYKGLNVPGVAGTRSPDPFIGVAVKLGQDGPVAVQEGFDLGGDHGLEPGLPAVLPAGHLIDVDLPVLSPVPLVVPHGR